MAGGGGVAPYPAPDFENVITAVQREFIRPLRRSVAGVNLVRDKVNRFGQWWNYDIQRWTYSEVGDDVVFSKDFPRIQSTSGDITPTTDPLPLITADLEFGGRGWRQMAEAGLDTTAMQSRGWRMMQAINKMILVGVGTGKFGPATGLLNTSVQTTTGGDWSDPRVLNSDIGEAIASLTDRGYGDTSFDLLMKGSDRGVLNEFMEFPTVAGARIGDNLSSAVRQVRFDNEVAAGEAHLVVNEPGHYDVVSPQDDPDSGFTFGLGRANAGSPITDDAGIGRTVMENMEAIWQHRTIRMMNILTFRMLRTGSGENGTPVQKITFS